MITCLGSNFKIMKFTIIMIIWLLVVILLETAVCSGLGFLVTVILIIGAAYGSDNDLKEK